MCSIPMIDRCGPAALHSKYSHARRLASYLLTGVAILLLQSCSLVLDFDQCSSDADCPAAGVCTDGICKSPPRVEVVNHIGEDVTWTADNVYVLKGVITVTSPSVLTIEPGTRVLAEKGAALVALAGARIEAAGTRQAPIVFSSAEPVGRRRAGDWGGVALIGKAPVNRENFGLRINAEEQHPLVGGSAPTWNCGTIKYVRIEFGGGLVAGDNALNGLTLAGCGTDTVVDYLHVHKGDDDCLEIFGGTVNVRHVVLTGASDDPFDIDTGWTGSAQYLAIQQDPVGNNALEIGNLAEDHSALPRTSPKIYNYTLIGGERSETNKDIEQRGVHIKEGASAFLSHGIIMGHHAVAVEVTGPESIALAEEGSIVVRNTLFYDVGESGTDYFIEGPAEPSDSVPGADAGTEPDAGSDADAGSDPDAGSNPDADTGTGEPEGGDFFDQAAYFTQPQFHNIFGEDPGIERPYDLTNPSWIPQATYTAGENITPPPASEGFDPTGVYLGAFAPGSIPWTEGWTDYPRN